MQAPASGLGFVHVPATSKFDVLPLSTHTKHPAFFFQCAPLETYVARASWCFTCTCTLHSVTGIRMHKPCFRSMLLLSHAEATSQRSSLYRLTCGTRYTQRRGAQLGKVLGKCVVANLATGGTRLPIMATREALRVEP
jgi:hypothetical protein